MHLIITFRSRQIFEFVLYVCAGLTMVDEYRRSLKTSIRTHLLKYKSWGYAKVFQQPQTLDLSTWEALTGYNVTTQSQQLNLNFFQNHTITHPLSLAIITYIYTHVQWIT